MGGGGGEEQALRNPKAGKEAGQTGHGPEPRANSPVRKGILTATVRPGPQGQALRKPKAGQETRTTPAKGSKRQGLDELSSQKQADKFASQS